MSNPAKLQKTPIVDRNGVKSTRMKRPAVTAKAATPVDPSAAKSVAPLAPSAFIVNEETIRRGAERLFSSGNFTDMESALAFSGAMDAGFYTDDENPPKAPTQNAKMARVAASFKREWPKLTPVDYSDRFLNIPRDKCLYADNEFEYAAAVEYHLRTAFETEDPHGEVLRNRTTVRDGLAGRWEPLMAADVVVYLRSALPVASGQRDTAAE